MKPVFGFENPAHFAHLHAEGSFAEGREHLLFLKESQVAPLGSQAVLGKFFRQSGKFRSRFNLI